MVKIMHTHKLTVILMVIFLLIVAALIYFKIRAQNASLQELTAEIEKKEFIYFRNIDGVGVDEFYLSNLRPVAIVIDNSFDARPAVGIEHASLVYETIAEGSITRLLAIFDPQEIPETVGPVRSLRPYFLSWANEVDAVSVHVGGSPQALKDIKTLDNINEFSNGQFFWREKKRPAPHNVFTSHMLLMNAIDAFKYSTTTTFTKWAYATQTPEMLEEFINEVVIDFSLEPYKVTWRYDKEKYLYRRLVDNKEEISSTANIVVMVVPSRVIDNELRRELRMIGSGKAWVFQNGNLTQGTWIKKDFDSRTKFVDTQGEPIQFFPGTAWVEVVDDEDKLNFF